MHSPRYLCFLLQGWRIRSLTTIDLEPRLVLESLGPC